MEVKAIDCYWDTAHFHLFKVNESLPVKLHLLKLRGSSFQTILINGS
jgi:hypothetical protein